MLARVLSLGLIMLIGAVEASAQTCLGLPSFSEGPYQASAGVSFTDGAQGFEGGLALGTNNIFGGASIEFTNFSDLDSSATSFGANLGASFTLNERERIEACPVGAVIITTGPDVSPVVGTEVDVSGVGLRGGGRLGVVALESGNLEIVPTFGLDIAYDRVTAELGAVETTERETYVIARVGVGFTLNKRIGFLPVLGIPLGLDGADPEFSFIVAYAFGQ